MYEVTPKRRKICKPLIRRNYQSFAAKCVKSKCTQSAIIKEICQLVRKDVERICSDKVDSILRCASKESLKEFQLDILIHQFKDQAPTLLTIIENSLHTKKSKHNFKLVLVLIIAMICKFRRPSYCLLQKIISLILYEGHSSKQVSIAKAKPTNIPVSHHQNNKFKTKTKTTDHVSIISYKMCEHFCSS